MHVNAKYFMHIFLTISVYLNNSSGTSKLFDYNLHSLSMQITFTVFQKNNCMKWPFQSYFILDLNPTVLSKTTL